MNNFILYRKPENICLPEEMWKPYMGNGRFISAYKEHINGKFINQNLYLRLAANKDIPAIEELITRCYPPEALRDSNPYDFYRFINFGHGLLVETKQKQLIGCLFEEAYDTPDKTSYSLRLAIDDHVKSKDLGTLLVEYSTLLAMERGSKVKRGLLKTDNFISAHILINKLGWVCDGFHNDLDWIGPSFTINIPLTIDNFVLNRIDPNKLVNYLHKLEKGKDYLLADWDDNEGLQNIFESGKYIIIALLKPGLFKNNKYQFAAFAVEQMTSR
jgi:N-acetylglutamate synthase and related acetyltransferases